MKKIIYYVASTLDGYISGPDDDISKFIQQGKGVEKYMQDLQNFDTVIMGRKTYEIGYKYGLLPGQPGYPHMDHYIFSDTLSFENPHEKVNTRKIDIKTIEDLKQGNGSDIYLCGGGEFAGWLLDNRMIDTLKLKLNPVAIGEGIKLFGSSKTKISLKLTDQESFDDGMLLLTYDILY